MELVDFENNAEMHITNTWRIGFDPAENGPSEDCVYRPQRHKKLSSRSVVLPGAETKLRLQIPLGGEDFDYQPTWATYLIQRKVKRKNRWREPAHCRLCHCWQQRNAVGMNRLSMEPLISGLARICESLNLLSRWICLTQCALERLVSMAPQKIWGSASWRAETNFGQSARSC